MGTRREVKVGAFVLVSLAAISLVIFLIGDERGLFRAKQDYAVVFEDVEGIKRGSPVRMGGIDVGAVTDVGYGPDPGDPRLYVRIQVAQAEARRIRVDSVAQISPKGFLGDKMISVTVGSANQPPLPPGAVIQTGAGSGLDDMLKKVDSIGRRIEQVLINLEATTGTLAEQDFREDVRTSVKSLSSILRAVDDGDGYAARLVKDPAEADRVSSAVGHLEQTTDELRQTAAGLNRLVARVNQGPGFAHDLVYGDAPTQSLVQFGQAAEEVALTLRGVREGDGLAHGLLYGGAQTDDMMANLTAATRDLRQIVADVRAGKGTVGALLVDPSVYEDLKVVLGNVQRNRALRALVRYSIKRDETGPAVEVRDPAPAGQSPRRASGRASGGGTASSGP